MPERLRSTCDRPTTGSPTFRSGTLTLRDDASETGMTTLTDRLLIVAMSWAALLVFAVVIRALPKRILPGNHAVSPLDWVVVGTVSGGSAVGILRHEPTSFYLVALVLVLAVYAAAVAVRRRQAGS